VNNHLRGRVRKIPKAERKPLEGLGTVHGPYLCFYGGPFSQWDSCLFEIDGYKYTSAEQYMMAQKAYLFGDDKVLHKILDTDSPAEQKALGKKVKGFSKRTWEAVARDVVARASFAKFTSSQDLMDDLLSTEGYYLVEASPTDVIWGIGLAEHDENCGDRSAWRGKNWLGQVLTETRDRFLGLQQRAVKGLL
jgi:ribA/ribD-fused uncharacterized protein